ncbi:MAG: ABC transporter ATP-binding protein, partial [Holdemanella sp.]|nr:ABC transporter ATP-binding protein [Holdemanella sp.]
MKLIKHFLSYYKNYMHLFIIDMICACTISIIDLCFPLILNFCTRDLFLREAKIISSYLPYIALGLFVMYILRAFSRYFVAYQGHMMGAQMERDMRKDLFDHYQRLSFSYYDKNNTGIMMSKVVSDLFDISEFAHHGPENLFISVLKICGSFIVLSRINLPLSMILLAVTLLMMVFSYTQNKSMRKTFMENR